LVGLLNYFDKRMGWESSASVSGCCPRLATRNRRKNSLCQASNVRLPQLVVGSQELLSDFVEFWLENEP
jgi:hypothetical protein